MLEEPSPFADVERLTITAQRLHDAIGHLERWSGSCIATGVRAKADQELAGVTRTLRQPQSAGRNERAITHVKRLEAMLSLSLGSAAKRCRTAADELAVVEEHAPEPLNRDGVTACSAADLARRLDRAAHAEQHC